MNIYIIVCDPFIYNLISIECVTQIQTNISLCLQCQVQGYTFWKQIVLAGKDLRIITKIMFDLSDSIKNMMLQEVCPRERGDIGN